MAIMSVCSSSTFETIASVDSLKALLGVTTTADDDLMADILQRSTNAMERYIGRPLRFATYYEKVRSFGSMNLQVTNTPIQRVLRVLKDDFLVASSEYEIQDPEAGLLYRQFGWAWSAGVVTDLVPHVVPGTERFSFAVEYQGGYAETSATTTQIGMPRALEEANLLIAQTWYLGRKRDPTIKSKQVGDLRMQFQDDEFFTGFPKTATVILDRFVRIV